MVSVLGLSLFCFFPHLFFFPAILFSYLFFSIFCSQSSYILIMKGVSWCISSFWGCMTVVLRYMVTALLEYLNLFSWFNSYLILSYSNCTMQNRLSFSSQTTIFLKFRLFFQSFCSLLSASYFSKKISGKIVFCTW